MNGREMKLSSLSRLCGVSRQSIYNMLGKVSVFNSVFVKMLTNLGINYKDVTCEKDSVSSLMALAPARVRSVAFKLVDYCKRYGASLLLFGSRVRGRTDVQADWDFGVWFGGAVRDKELVRLKQELSDEAFPYRVDVVNMNLAPTWFLDSVRESYVVLEGRDSFAGSNRRAA